MNKLYSLLWLIIFAGVLFSFYKFFRYRENLYRITFWGGTAVLILMTLLQPKPLEFTEIEQAAFVSVLRDTSTELKKYSEIDDVYFSDIAATENLEIKLVVNDTASENFPATITDDAKRIFLHALTDNWVDLSNIPISRIKIKVTVIPKENSIFEPSKIGV